MPAGIIPLAIISDTHLPPASMVGNPIRAALIGFPTIEAGGKCVSEIIASGIIPAGMEMMDKALIHATDNFVKAGYPRDAESMLIVELDGTETEVEELIEKVSNIAKRNKSSSIKISKNEKQRLKFWAGRKAAFPACGDMAPDYYCMDGTIPVSYTHLTLPTTPYV